MANAAVGMRSLLLFSILLCACGDATQSSSDDEALKAKAPIPYVLQWVGEYDATSNVGDVDWVILRKTGTFAASVNGHVETGRFAGPSKPGQWPLKIAFITKGDYFTGTISQWNDANGYAVMSIDHYGTKQTVTAPWKSGGETMCDDTGGSWTDDDADPKTGLYCVCPSTQKWIPSAGGCTH